MYQAIMDELRSLFSKTHLSEREYSLSLKLAAIQLWNSYQRGAGIAAAANYADPDVQAAYMLRYFLPYSMIVSEILRRHCITLASRRTVNAAIFGGGPAPEALSIARTIISAAPRPQALNITVYDHNPQWRPVLERITPRLLRELAPGLTCSIAFEQISIFDDFSHNANLMRKIESFDLIVFQNCLNEVDETNLDAATSNIRNIFSQINPDAILLLANAENYSDFVALCQQVRVFVLNDYDVDLCDCGRIDFSCRALYDTIPDSINGVLYFHPHCGVNNGLNLRAQPAFDYLIARLSSR